MRTNDIISWASQGYAIYPLVANTKTPLKGSHGYKDASSDIAKVAEWLADNQGINVGMSLQPSHLLVVDVDRHTDASGKTMPSGVASIKDLARSGKVLPANTYIEQTPANGFHYFFKYQGDALPQREALYPGVDVLTRAVMISPSSIGEGQYRPIGCDNLADAKPVPKWLLDELQGHKSNVSAERASFTRKTWAGRMLDDLVGGTSVGDRNVYLTSLIGKLFNTGCQTETAYELLQFANDRLETPLPGREVNQIFKSILKKVTR